MSNKVIIQISAKEGSSKTNIAIALQRLLHSAGKQCFLPPDVQLDKKMHLTDEELMDHIRHADIEVMILEGQSLV